jgi:hypothetical protein
LLTIKKDSRFANLTFLRAHGLTLVDFYRLLCPWEFLEVDNRLEFRILLVAANELKEGNRHLKEWIILQEKKTKKKKDKVF